MPELPEVETVRRGVAQVAVGKVIERVVARREDLRLPVPTAELIAHCTGQRIAEVARRGKYLLLGVGGGWVIIHLGMSGTLVFTRAESPLARHDHLDLVLDGGVVLRYNDPRRFGVVVWGGAEPQRHPLLAELGPEPLGPGFSAEYLLAVARKRTVAIKQLVMDSRVVVGIGNIYASESLFRAGVNPERPARELTPAEAGRVVESARAVLTAAIAKGGTTLRDYQQSDGRPGYFQLELAVYGKTGEPCPRCGATLRQLRQGQRMSYFCPDCQPRESSRQ